MNLKACGIFRLSIILNAFLLILKPKEISCCVGAGAFGGQHRLWFQGVLAVLINILVPAGNCS